MSCSAKAVANHFLKLAKDQGVQLTPMKIQKLVYFAHGWHLAIFDSQPLIDEQVEAWPYGPVIPSLYHEFKRFGNTPITRMAREFDTDGITEVTPQLALTGELNEFFDKIWDEYGSIDAIELSNMTHEPDTPWAEVWGENGVPKNTDIESSRIENYFIRLANSNDGE